MGKKILKGLLFVMFLSGAVIASEENDSPNYINHEYITISKQQLIEHKEQLKINSQITDRTDNRVILLEQEICGLKQEICGLKQAMESQIQQNVELKQQNVELKQQNVKLDKMLQQVLDLMQQQKK